MDTDAILAERGSRYGDYSDVAGTSQKLQQVMQNTANWDTLPPYTRESLTLIANKISRALNGDPSYLDNWVDIQGYAKLVELELTQEK